MSRDWAADAEEAKTKGNEALASKDFDQAVQWYTTAIDLSKRVPPPNQRHVYFSNRSAAYLSKGFAESALKDASEAVALKPDWPKGYARKGAALHAMKKYADAERVYEDALKQFPGDASLESGLASVRADHEAVKSGGLGARGGGAGGGGGLEDLLHDPDAMERLRLDPRTQEFMKDPAFVDKIEHLRANPDRLQLLVASDRRVAVALGVMLGVDLKMEEEPSEEEREAARKAEQEREAARKLAEEERAREEERKRREAETPEERAARESRERAEAAKERGNALYKKREFEAALAAFDEAIREQPANMTYVLNRAAVLLEQGKLEETLAECDKALEVGRANHAPYEQVAKVFERRGNAFLKANRMEDALVEYRKAQLENKTQVVEDKIRKIEHALKQRAEREYLDPAKGAEAKERGNAKFKSGDFPGAVADYSDAIKRDPSNAVYYVNRAAALTKLGEFGRALEDAEKAIELDPKYVKAYARRGKIEQFAKKYHRALESFGKGLELDANDAECQEGLRAVRELMLKDDDDPETRFQRAMEDPEIRQIVQDPVMMQVLREMKEDPRSSSKHLANAGIRAKIEKLVAAGVLKMG